MRIMYVCEEEEIEIGRKRAPGKCPSCGGKVEAVDIKARGIFCYLFPLCFRIKTNYFCTLCSKRLVLNSQIHHL
ncbi:hypothetical protein ABFS82_10G068900 [Erythranthe guttata]|uniref:Zinc-ribbon 15 domain-containing protein n=1 Tax=Erythranthe guttata TaxID=4155 RepID=A0A022PRQ5_ERYGU|nr:hypothetical protein MIMGU_mgv1a025075mg [Erythranthe guttata]